MASGTVELKLYSAAGSLVQTQSGAADFFLETADISFGDTERSKHVDAIRMELDGVNNGDEVTVELGTRETLEDSVSWTTVTSTIENGLKIYHCFLDAVFFRFKISSTSFVSRFRLSMVQFHGQKSGGSSL